MSLFTLGLSILLTALHPQECLGQRPEEVDRDSIIDIPTLESPASLAPAHLKKYLGDGFSLEIPFDAEVMRESLLPGIPPEASIGLDSLVRIRGKSVDVTAITAPEGFRRETGPVYDLQVRVFTNPDEEPLDDWVQRLFDEYLMNIGLTEQKLKEIGASFHPPVVDSVAGLQVVRYMPACPDCMLYRTYFGRGQAVVEVAFAFSFFSGGGDPLRAVQEVVYAHILNSFRWR